MTHPCPEPLSDATLIEYWAGDLNDEQAGPVEEHLFACGECSARLTQLAALGDGVAALARRGAISGMVSRALLNRMQRDGVHVRMFSLAPGETIPCAVFPGDDLVVTHLRADFTGVGAVNVQVKGPGPVPFASLENVPVSGPFDDVLWATPASLIQQMPSIRLELTMTSSGPEPAELGRYVLEHTAARRESS